MNARFPPDFNGGPTLLICPTRSELKSLSELLLKISKTTSTDLVVVESPALLVIARSCDSDIGLKSLNKLGKRMEFAWSLSAPKWEVFSEMLRILADSPKTGHQYLEANEDDAVVIVSSERRLPSKLDQI